MSIRFFILQSCWVLAISSGLLLFFKGFLFSRLNLTNASTCRNPPVALSPQHHAFNKSATEECWFDSSYRRVIVFVIDALRFDFAAPSSKSAPYLNHFPLITRLLKEDEGKQFKHSFLYHFVADPPTITLQRLKSLATGTLPTFVEALENFGGSEVREDSWLKQLSIQGARAVLVGDDTWNDLFGHYFTDSHPMHSLNLMDLHGVDHGVMSIIPSYIENPLKDKKELILGHFLGVDHCGHYVGPDHHLMTEKLEELSAFLEIMVDNIKKHPDTLLILMGDHGMTFRGEHGSNTDLETGSALFAYSAKGIFHSSWIEQVEKQLGQKWWTPQDTVEDSLMSTDFIELESKQWRSVPQVDLVPTISLLLGIPIPFSNLGSIIPEVFAVDEIATESDQSREQRSIENVANVYRLNSHQLFRYLEEYSKVHGKIDSIDSWKRTLNRADIHYNDGNMKEAYLYYAKANRLALAGCKKIWAKFDFNMMWAGAIMTTLWLLLWISSDDSTRSEKNLIFGIFLGVCAWCVTPTLLWKRLLFGFPVEELGQKESLIFISALGMSLMFFYSLCRRIFLRLSWLKITWRIHYVNDFLSLVAIGTQFGGNFANSYIENEDNITMGLLQTQALGYLFQLLITSYLCAYLKRSTSALRSAQKRLLWNLGLYMALVRLSGHFTICRHEQLRCEATFTEDDSFLFSLSFILPFVIPSLIKRGLNFTPSTAVYRFWINYGFHLALMCSSVFWALSALTKDAFVEGLKHYFARLLFFLCLGMLIYWLWNPVVSESCTGASQFNAAFWTLLTIIYAYLSITQQPVAALVFACSFLHIWSFIKLTTASEAHQSCFEALLHGEGKVEGPPALSLHNSVCYAQLSTHYFFRTGHQAVISSIHWKTAFIGLSEVNFILSPILITSNTLASFFLFSSALPLLVMVENELQPQKLETIKATLGKSITTMLFYWLLLSLFSMVGIIKYYGHLMLYNAWGPRVMLLGLITLTQSLWFLLLVWPSFLRMKSAHCNINKTAKLKYYDLCKISTAN